MSTSQKCYHTFIYSILLFCSFAVKLLRYEWPDSYHYIQRGVLHRTYRAYVIYYLFNIIWTVMSSVQNIYENYLIRKHNSIW